MTEKREIIIKTQDGKGYFHFSLPLVVYNNTRGCYRLIMNANTIGEFSEEKYAVHVMNYLLTKYLYYTYESTDCSKSAIIPVPSNEVMESVSEESLIDDVPIKESGDAQ